MSELQTFSFNNKYIVVDGENYWHYTYGGKWTATKSIIIEGVSFYNSNKPLIEERP